MGFSQRCWHPVSLSPVRSTLIAFLPPSLDDLPGIKQGLEPVGVEGPAAQICPSRPFPFLRSLAQQPLTSPSVECLNLRPFQAWHITFHFVSDVCLEVCQVTIPVWKSLKKLFV